jgi:hypothetical protein
MGHAEVASSRIGREKVDIIGFTLSVSQPLESVQSPGVHASNVTEPTRLVVSVFILWYVILGTAVTVLP